MLGQDTLVFITTVNTIIFKIASFQTIDSFFLNGRKTANNFNYYLLDASNYRTWRSNELIGQHIWSHVCQKCVDKYI